MIKMIVSSFYNTLINKEEAIPATTMLEIERIRNNNILFVVATNGLYEEVLDYNKDFPFLDYIISLNGSCIYDVKKEKEIYKKKITQSKLQKIKELFDNQEIIYYTDKHQYHDLEEIKDKDVYKVEIKLLSPPDTQQIEKLKKYKLNSSILNKDPETYLEITSYQASMFAGTDQIALKNNISLREVLVIAGNASEESLVKNIKKSYVVENGDKLLKKSTRKRTFSNNQRGVESVLQKVIS